MDLTCTRVLVTGAAGFLGSHVCHALVRAGFDVTGLVREQTDLTRIRDIAGRMDVRALRPGPPSLSLFGNNGFDAVIHAATNYGRAGSANSDLVADNILFPLALCEAHDQRGGRALFVNIDSFFSRPAEESRYLLPYVTTKRHFREWLALRPPESVTVSLRLEHVYGPDDSPQKFVPWLLKQLTMDPPVCIPLTTGEVRRDFVYVADVTAAIITVLKTAGRHLPGVTDLEVGTGEPITVRNFVETAHALAQSRAVLQFGAVAERAGEIRSSRANTSALRHLGWTPLFSPTQGLNQCLSVNGGEI